MNSSKGGYGEGYGAGIGGGFAHGAVPGGQPHPHPHPYLLHRHQQLPDLGGLQQGDGYRIPPFGQHPNQNQQFMPFGYRGPGGGGGFNLYQNPQRRNSAYSTHLYEVNADNDNAESYVSITNRRGGSCSGTNFSVAPTIHFPQLSTASANNWHLPFNPPNVMPPVVTPPPPNPASAAAIDGGGGGSVPAGRPTGFGGMAWLGTGGGGGARPPRLEALAASEEVATDPPRRRPPLPPPAPPSVPAAAAAASARAAQALAARASPTRTWEVNIRPGSESQTASAMSASLRAVPGSPTQRSSSTDSGAPVSDARRRTESELGGTRRRSLLGRLRRALCSLTACMSLPFLIVLAVPAVTVAVVTRTVFLPVASQVWDEVHATRRRSCEAQQDAHSAHVYRLAAAFSTAFETTVFDPEGTATTRATTAAGTGDLLPLLCHLMTQAVSAWSITAIASGAVAQGGYAMCARGPNDATTADEDGVDWMGLVTADGGTLGGVYLVNSSTYDFIYPLVPAIDSARDNPLIAGHMAAVRSDSPAIVAFKELVTAGGGGGATAMEDLPPHLRWASGDGDGAMYFALPFLARTTSGTGVDSSSRSEEESSKDDVDATALATALGSSTTTTTTGTAAGYNDIGFVEVRVEYQSLAAAMMEWSGGSGDGALYAMLDPAVFASAGPRVVANNWGQPVRAVDPECTSWVCEGGVADGQGSAQQQQQLLRPADVADEHVRAAMQRLNLRGFDGVLAASGSDMSSSSFSDTVGYVHGGAYVAASAWSHTTAEGHTTFNVLVSVQDAAKGSIWGLYTPLLIVCTVLPVLLLLVAYAALVEYCLARPLRTISAALMTGMLFVEERADEGEREGQDRRRPLNPLMFRDTDDRTFGTVDMSEEGDGYSNDAKRRRREVSLGGRFLRVAEVEGLLGTYNHTMLRLREADMYMPQMAGMVHRAMCIATTSSSSGSDEPSNAHSSGSSNASNSRGLSTPTGSGPPVNTRTTTTSILARGGRSGSGSPSASTGTAPRSELLSRGGSASQDLTANSTASSNTSDRLSSTEHSAPCARHGSRSRSDSGASARPPGQLAAVEVTTTIVQLFPRDQNLLPSTRAGAHRGRYRAAFHSGPYGHFLSPVGAERYFTHISRLADRFGGVIHAANPELTTVIFNAGVLNVRVALSGSPAAARVELEAAAVAADATAAVRFALALGGCFERESRLIFPTQMIVDTVPVKLCRYLSGSAHNFLFFSGRNIYWRLFYVPLQLNLRVTLTEETALLVWKSVRCIPVEALRIDDEPAVALRGNDNSASGGTRNLHEGEGVASSSGPAPAANARHTHHPYNDNSGHHTPAALQQHVVLYEALRGSATTPQWAQYRDCFNGAFMAMIRGDYDSALLAFARIGTIDALDVPLMPGSMSELSELAERGAGVGVGVGIGRRRGGSVGRSARTLRNRPSVVTWAQVPFSYRDYPASRTSQLARMAAICERNVRLAIHDPYVHTLAVSGLIDRSDDLQDRPLWLGSGGVASTGATDTRASSTVSGLSHSGDEKSGGAGGRGAASRGRVRRLARKAREADARALAATVANPLTPLPLTALATFFHKLPHQIEDCTGGRWSIALSKLIAKAAAADMSNSTR